MKSIFSIICFSAATLLTSAAGHAEIIVGVGAPFTGPNAAVGEQFKRGAEKAVADINAKGGIAGEKVTLSYGDDASDPKQGISVANNFAGQGVTFVIGHYNSGVSIPASEVYAENGILEITPGSTNPVYTERDLWNTIRICGRDDQQGKVAGEYIAKNFPQKRVAILDDKTAYGKGIAEEVMKALKQASIAPVIADSINVGDKDYSALITRLKEAKVDVIYFGGLYTEAGLLSRQAADQGLKAVLVGGDGIASSEYAAIAGSASEGTLMTFAPDPRNNPAAQDVAKSIQKDGFEPEAYTLYAYAAVQVLKEGIEKAGSLDPQEVAATLENGEPLHTVIGDFALNKKGDRNDEDFIMYRWNKQADNTVTYQPIK